MIQEEASIIWNKLIERPKQWILDKLFRGVSWLLKSSIIHGWAFVFLGLISGIICFDMHQKNMFLAYFLLILLIIIGIALMLLVIYLKHKYRQNKLKRNRNPKNSNIPSELRKSSNTTKSKRISTPNGFIFGKIEDEYITKPETMDGHIMVVDGVGSGKSSCLAIPTLCNWKSRVFTIDIKGELYQKTKTYRPDVKVFNPQNDNSWGYDPYVFLKNSRNEAQEARAIAQAIIPLPPETKDPFWIESSQSVLTGAILHYYEDCSFIDTLEQIQSNSPQNLIEIIAQSYNAKARMCVGNFVGMDDKTLSGIFAELGRGIITLVTDDEIISALSKLKVITPEDLEYGNDIYIHIPEYLLRQWKNLLTLIVNQFLTFFERRDENNDTPILFLLDEFPRLGKIPSIIDGLATLRSKKITICLITQSLAQLDSIYGENERKVISDTCSYKAILGATDADTQEYFSKLVGTYERTKTSSNVNSDPYLGMSTGKGLQTTTEEKRIIRPEEFSTLTDIVLLTPFGFYRVDKAPYYNENYAPVSFSTQKTQSTTQSKTYQKPITKTQFTLPPIPTKPKSTQEIQLKPGKSLKLHFDIINNQAKVSQKT